MALRTLKNTLVFVSLAVLFGCQYEFAKLTGKCKDAGTKKNLCLATVLLLCENSPDAAKYRNYGDVCTHPDGYAMMLQAMCPTPPPCGSNTP